MAYKLSLFILLIVFIPLSQVCGKTNDVEMTHLSLKDVQGLFGGRNIYINPQGMIWVQVVDKNRMEKRFQFQLSSKELNEIKLIVFQNNNLEFKTKERMEGPAADEAYLTLMVRLTTGETHKVGKWAHDAHPQFDAIYHWLLLRTSTQTKTLYEGSYQNDWSPPEFKELFKDSQLS